MMAFNPWQALQPSISCTTSHVTPIVSSEDIMLSSETSTHDHFTHCQLHLLIFLLSETVKGAFVQTSEDL